MQELIFETDQTELEEYADQLATDTFLPLWKNDQLYLQTLTCNPTAFYQALVELSEKWRIPIEEEADVRRAIQIFLDNSDNNR